MFADTDAITVTDIFLFDGRDVVNRIIKHSALDECCNARCD